MSNSSQSQDAGDAKVPDDVDRNSRLMESIMHSLRGQSSSSNFYMGNSGESNLGEISFESTTGNNSDTNGGNNSDNSGLGSLGNSVGFNFEADEGGLSSGNLYKSSPNDSSTDSCNGKGDQEDPSQNSRIASSSSITKKQKKNVISNGTSSSSSTNTSTNNKGLNQQQTAPPTREKESFNEDAANMAVANLQSIAKSYADGTFSPSKGSSSSYRQADSKSISSFENKIKVEDSYMASMSYSSLSAKIGAPKASNTNDSIVDDESSRKRRATSQDGRSVDDSGGYNTDDDEGDDFDDHHQGSSFSAGNGGSNNKGKGRDGHAKLNESSGRGLHTANNDSGGGGGHMTKKKRTSDNKRVERNQREKERSLRIAKQIGELRNLLSSGGVIVPKGTKSSVLTEAANYIRMLQQHQYRSEIDRNQLVQQMQLIGGGAHGPQAAAAIRHVAAQNGVWSLGNFGGVPPKSAMTFYSPTNTTVDQGNKFQQQPQAMHETSTTFNPSKSVAVSEYQHIFNACGAGMAITSMGGAFIDCNQLFCQLSEYTKQEICSLTIFNLTAREDLQNAFDQISQLISPPMDENGMCLGRDKLKPVVVRGAMKNRNDLGLSVALVKGDDGVAKCFCVTLVKNPTSPFDTSRPIPASFDSIIPRCTTTSKNSGAEMSSTTPAFTSG